MARSEQCRNVLLHERYIVDVIDLHLDLVNIDRRGLQALIGRAIRHEDGIIHVGKALRSFGLKGANNLESLIIYENVSPIGSVPVVVKRF